MQLAIRRALYLVTIALFLLVIPLILAYGVGIRYDYGAKKFVRTGGMFISTQPKNVSVYVNEKLFANKTPLHIRYLSPQNYVIRITSPNYTPIEFTAQITAGIATTIPKLELDPQKPTSASTVTAHAIFSSPFDDQTLLINDTAGAKKISHISHINSESCPDLLLAPQHVLWDPLHSQAIIADAEAWHIVAFNPCKIRATISREQANVLGFSFDADSFWAKKQDTSLILFLNGKNEILTKESGPEMAILQKGLPAFKAISSRNNTAIFFNEDTEASATINGITNATLLNESMLLIQSSTGAYLADTQKKRFVFLDDSIGSFTVHNDRMWYASGTEAWEVSLTTLEKKFITRFSETIVSLSLSGKGNALYVTFANSYVLWELNQSIPIHSKKEFVPESKMQFQLMQENRLRKFTLLSGNLTIEDFQL